VVARGFNDKDNRVVVKVLPGKLDDVGTILAATNPEDIRADPGGPVRLTGTRPAPATTFGTST
jgi:hypothetical protein